MNSYRVVLLHYPNFLWIVATPPRFFGAVLFEEKE